jgi:adenylate cyclase
MFVTRNYKIKNVFLYTLAGTVIGAGVGLALHYIDRIDVMLPLTRGTLVGFFVGTAIGLCEEFLFLEKFRKKSYLFLLLFRVIAYLIVFAFFELLINSLTKFAVSELSIKDSIYFAFYLENYFRDLGIIAVISVITISVFQIKRLHRPGDLIKYVTGRYHLPEEVNKIFLFIDLKSSTAIAEKLGNTKYSSFLIDYFHDMTGAILMSKAEIYQYIGDEIILTWNFKSGVKYARCINCFFDILTSIEWNKEKYFKKYGVHPEFKAALHAGNVSVTWIGTIKKEIVYHGDVVNTTARIQDECNKYDQKFLLSEYMLQNVELPEYLRSEFVGELQLKGKEKKVKIFGLKSIAEI